MSLIRRVRGRRAARMWPEYRHPPGLTAEVWEKWDTGYCIFLALAMHDRFGWDICVQAWIMPGEPEVISHAWVRHPAGPEIDNLGPVPPGFVDFGGDIIHTFTNRGDYLEYLGRSSAGCRDYCAEANTYIDRWLLPELMRWGLL